MLIRNDEKKGYLRQFEIMDKRRSHLLLCMQDLRQ
jgi:hypothetical protein